MNKPLCFILMPSGQKPDRKGNTVDFDAVYREIITPAIERAGLEPLRSDASLSGGVIHKPTFEQLLLSEFAIADLTGASVNVFYELGFRQAERPSQTVLIVADSESDSFDVGLMRALTYKLSNDGVPSNADADAQKLAERLILIAQKIVREGAQTSSSIYRLVEHHAGVDHTKTDVFRERAEYSNEIEQHLAAARKGTVEDVRQVESELGSIRDQESAPVIDLLLSYRAVEAWEEMIALVDKMSAPLARSLMVQEQLALALNRAERGEEAEQVVKELLIGYGPSSETNSILGRIYKDRWEAALELNDTSTANAFLDKAIEAYLQGFEADWRDALPGINAVTLMEIRDPTDPRRERLLLLVSYAAERRIALGHADYWDYATLLELAVLSGNNSRAMELIGKVLGAVREAWEPKTTIRNLRLIRRAREQRNEETGWVKEIEGALGEKTDTNTSAGM